MEQQTNPEKINLLQEKIDLYEKRIELIEQKHQLEVDTLKAQLTKMNERLDEMSKQHKGEIPQQISSNLEVKEFKPIATSEKDIEFDVKYNYQEGRITFITPHLAYIYLHVSGTISNLRIPQGRYAYAYVGGFPCRPKPGSSLAVMEGIVQERDYDHGNCGCTLFFGDNGCLKVQSDDGIFTRQWVAGHGRFWVGGSGLVEI